MSDDNESIDNPNNAEYSSKSDFSKAEVVRTQVIKCDQVRSQEMRHGYYNHDKLGNSVYIPDSRQEWVASDKALLYLLTPEIKRNKFTQKVKNILNKEKDTIENFGVFPIISDGKKIITKTELKKTIPRLDQSFPIEVAIKNKQGSIIKIEIQEERGTYNNNFHYYWDAMVSIYDELYQELNNLIDICNYFKQKVSY